MRFQSYFNTALLVLLQYDGSIPLTHFLKQYFSQRKKHGSKDRKWIAHLCYTYYRLGHSVKELEPADRLKIALFLCNESAWDWYILFDESWLENWSSSVKERIAFVKKKYPSFSLADVFPWKDELSEGVDAELFALSHFIQPDLFLRIRPNQEGTTLRKLKEAEITFTKITDQCLALTNASKIDTILEIDKEVVVQDKSSQRIAEFLQLTTYHLQLITMPVWDCCAASGGKSILAKDVLGNIELTVSDIRPSIIQNLKKRFERAGIKNYHAFVSDIANHRQSTLDFRLILCDAPCTGSGTWGRTPEQLYFFKKDKINDYAAIQARIATNAISSLQKDGYFLYITCSVFKKENEAIKEMILKKFPVELVRAEVLKGYNQKADSMYAALFKMR